MHRLKFKYAAAYNFLCFGPEGIELHLENMGNILVVMGENWHDVNPVTGKPGSNGTGKSCLQDIFSYALYGKITRKATEITQEKMIHKESKKKLRVEVVWDKYRVVRTRKPDSLRLWESEEGIWDDTTEITCGAGAPETQKKIESILGMNHKSFVGTTVFDDRNDHAFLELDGPTKRLLVENLLSLEKYREYSKVAKAVKSDAEKAIKALTAEYEKALVDLDNARSYSRQVAQQKETWRTNHKRQTDELTKQVFAIRQKMTESDNAAALAEYNANQDKIVSLRDLVAEGQSKREVVASILEEAKKRRDAAQQSLQTANLERNALSVEYNATLNLAMEVQDQINSVESLDPGVTCDKCYGTIDPKAAIPFAEKCREELSKHKARMTELEAKLASKTTEVETFSNHVKALMDGISDANKKDAELAARIRDGQLELSKIEGQPKPELDRDLAILQARVEDLNGQIARRRQEFDGESPYDRILEDAANSIQDRSDSVLCKQKEIRDYEKLIPYFKFWVDAFGDDGIRKFVIDGIIPSLNSQVAYWLDILIYGNLKLSFDNMLETTIERVPFDGDPFVYSVMSGGERRRMNLAVIHAFSHIQMLNCGACPSVLFLDEVVTNIDTNGKAAAFDMIQELAAERQIFLTTHDPELLDLLQGCQVIQLERRNGITKIAA